MKLIILLLVISNPLWAQVTRLQSVVNSYNFDEGRNDFARIDSIVYEYPNETVSGDENQQFAFTALGNTFCNQFITYKVFRTTEDVLYQRQRIIRDTDLNQMVFRVYDWSVFFPDAVVSSDTTYTLNPQHQIEKKQTRSFNLKGAVDTNWITNYRYDAEDRIASDSTWDYTDTLKKLMLCNQWNYDSSNTEKITHEYKNNIEYYQRITHLDSLQRMIWYEEKVLSSDSINFKSIFHDEYSYFDSIRLVKHVYVNTNISANYEELIQTTTDSLGRILLKEITRQEGSTYVPYHKTVWNYSDTALLAQEDFDYFKSQNYAQYLSRLILYEYTSSGKIAQIKTENFDFNKKLTSGKKSVYSYNSDNHLISFDQLYANTNTGEYGLGSNITYHWQKMTPDTNTTTASLPLQIYPNPFHHMLHFSFSYPKEGKGVITILNSLGQVVDTRTEDIHTGVNHLTYQRQLPEGTYYVSLYTPEFVYANLFQVN